MTKEKDLPKYIGEKIRYYRKQLNLTQEELGRKINTGKSRISNYETGYRTPQQDDLFELADALNISINDLFPPTTDGLDINRIYNQLHKERKQKVYNYAERQLEEQKQVVEIHGQTAAGEPIEYGDTYIEEKEVSYVPNGAEVALIINGDSMEPDFPNGSIVFYKKQPQVENGQIAIVEVDGGVTCKRIKFDYENEKVILQSLNEVYEDQVFEDDDVKVLGLVVQ